ncbi:hypothetical protein FRB97_005196, partial [Tulasnella sp. 331]
SAPAASSANAASSSTNGVLPKDAIPKNMAHAVDIDEEIPLEEVCLSSLAMSKIVKHGKEGREGRELSYGGGGGMGVLVGLDLEGVLEVADSFALPGRASASSNRDNASGTVEEDPIKGNAQYQRKMLAALKDVKGAHSVVGYYHTVFLGQFYKQSVVESLVSGVDKTRHGGVAVVHGKGVAAFKAFKLSQAYLNARKSSAAKFSTQSLTDNQLTFTEMFDELPVKVRSSPLAAAFLKHQTPTSGSSSLNPATLSLPSSSSHTRALESLIESLDALRSEENNAAYNLRQIARERGRMDQYIAKKREENATRVSQGLAPLPEEDYTRMFKIPVEPSRMEGMMLLGQVDSVARELEALAGAEMVKMYAAKAGGA